jgi:hypothetical protein
VAECGGGVGGGGGVSKRRGLLGVQQRPSLA